MRIELKSLHYSPTLSDDSNAFTANVYLDGKKAGTCKDNGNGGSVDVWPRECLDALIAHAKTLPDIVSASLTKDGKPFTYRPSVDTLIGEAFERAMRAKDFVKFHKGMASHLYTIDEAMGAIFVSKKLTPVEMSYWKSEAGRAKYLTSPRMEGRVFLNVLPMEDAWALYCKHAY